MSVLHPEKRCPGGARLRHWPADVLRLRDEYIGSDSLVTLRLFDGPPNTDVWRFAEQHELWVSSELGGAKTALAELDAAGLLTPRHTFNHCFALTDEDWARLAGCGASVNLAPRSDVYFGLGVSVPPIRARQRHGLRPGLSTDNELSYGLDMFSEMRALYQLHRSHALAAGATGDTATWPIPSAACGPASRLTSCWSEAAPLPLPMPPRRSSTSRARSPSTLS
jgi:5-methylthioadenosine/S-adenosylhomocysteine deaminase